MWNELLLWVEQYSGHGYDIDEEIDKLDKNLLFVDHYEWLTTFEHVLEELNEINDVFDEYGIEIPQSEFGTIDKVRKDFNSYYIEKLKHCFDIAKEQVNISNDIEVNIVDDLSNPVAALHAIVEMLIETPIDEIHEEDIFEDLDDDYYNIFTSVFMVSKQDLTNMAMTISSIRESYYENEDE